MKKSVELVFLAFMFLTVLVSGCAPASTPPISLPTTTPLPTDTPLPTSTRSPTVTPTPLCGTPAKPSAISSDTSKILVKYEPQDGQAYFGFTYRLWGDGMSTSDGMAWGDTRPFAVRICDSVKVELGGKTPTIIKVGPEWKTNGLLQPFSVALDDVNKVQAVLGSTVIPLVEWQSGGTTESDNVTTKDIASGQYDDYVTQYARDVKAYGHPLFIRLICGEFNGNWWQMCSPKANSNLTADDFVNAWRHVVNIFRKEGVTNVAWVWTPVAPVPLSAGDWGWDPNWQAYYPGDDYVDWVGADLNDWGKPSWLDPLYEFGVAHGKPFFLAEFAIRHLDVNLTHKQEINWLNAMFDYFESHPQIKAISYFNYKNNLDPNPTSPDHVTLYDGQVNYVPDVSDHDQRLIAGCDDIRALFASRIANPRYISTLVSAP
jgi:hypothetical protein